VLDIEMPDLDGISALPQLLARKRDLVVIMASTLTRRNAEISLKAAFPARRRRLHSKAGKHAQATAPETFRHGPDPEDPPSRRQGAAQRSPHHGEPAARTRS